MTSPPSNSGRRALVLGGGISGLAAALVLAEHFDAVTVLERDEYPAQPRVRAHAPHGAHAHVLLARGLQTMHRLLPTLGGWLDELGVVEQDLTRHVRFCYGGRWLPQEDSGIPFRACSRPVVEHLLLRAVREHPNVELRTGISITGLLAKDGRSGATFLDRDEHAQRLEADFTVVAIGRRAKLVDWFEALTGERAEEEVVDAGVTYTSCMFRPPPDADDDWSLIADVSRFPTQPEMSVLVRYSADEWLASAVSYGRATPPKSVGELIDRFAGMSTPVLADHLRTAEPLDEPRSYTNTANRRRRFGAIRQWPRRMVVLGDAVCALNPRYGQGMTVAILGAEQLDLALRASLGKEGTLDGVARTFQRALDRTLTIPWQIALMEDRLWAAKFADRPLDLGERIVTRIVRRALDTAFTDIDTYKRFMRVAHLIELPLHLAHPVTFAKLAFPGLRRVGATATDAS